ncbi:MAG: oligosaccharide flippase family protein [Roseovarius sp.]
MSRAPRSGRALAWGVPVLAEAAAFGRSIAFAWAIGPEELGRAMMLALTVRLVEMASDMGLDRQIVQAPDGDSSRFQAELQGLAAVRGGATALILLALAPLLAMLFDDGPQAGAYMALALVPLIRGAAHLDFRRAERRFCYGRMALVEGGATLAMLLAIGPALWFLADHRAMAAVLVAHALGLSLLSHAVAHRRYRLRLSRQALRRSWRFGAPLILNALMLFATFHADRLIVAKAYDWSTLALYGVALQLALLPAQIVGRAAASLALPALRAALMRNALAEVWPRLLSAHALLALALSLGFALFAPPVIAAVYGTAFRPDAALALALALAAGFRVLRTPYSQLAIAAGRTADPARANLWRALALGPAALCATVGWPLSAVAAAAALGEGAATLRAVHLARQTPRATHPKEAFA